MTKTEILERLQALPSIGEMPVDELEWLAEHGELEVHDPGEIVVTRDQPVDRMLVVLSGRIVVRVDHGAGPRLVIAWETGDVTGMLPYSRMTAPPEHNRTEEPSELLAVATRHFPEMVHRCPTFTTYTVHLMLDRARSFSTSELQDEKMISLGRLAAGLAHELNNPASAAVRSAKLLMDGMAEADLAARILGSVGLSADQLATVGMVRDRCRSRPGGEVLSGLAQAEREDEIADWLIRYGQDESHAVPLAETAVTLEDLEVLAGAVPHDLLDEALAWIATGCATYALVEDIERAATRVHELVAAVKRFTYMDAPTAHAAADVESGLRDSARVVASKARSRDASIELDVEADLPPVRAVGGELNQVWLNLIDNALDAVPESGHVRLSARRSGERVVVSVVDDGPGIPDDVLPKIFDPFFTTKAPGQGTGLGLDLSRRIVVRNLGELTVESQPGRTEFRVTLEIAEADEG